MKAPFTVDEVHTLTQLLGRCASERVILIGAAALGCHVPMTWRRTHDLDLTIMTDMETAAAALRAAGLVRDPKVEHRWLAQCVRLDVLPATSRDIERKRLVWPSGAIMSLVGFDLAFAHTLPVPLSATCAIQVPKLPVLAMLKMISWLDAPHERSRDLLDLGYLLSAYLDDDAARHWDDPRLAAFELDEHSPLALGHDIAEIAAPHHRERVLAFLDAFSDTGTQAFQQLASTGRIGHVDRETTLETRLLRLRQGVESEPAR